MIRLIKLFYNISKSLLMKLTCTCVYAFGDLDTLTIDASVNETALRFSSTNNTCILI